MGTIIMCPSDLPHIYMAVMSTFWNLRCMKTKDIHSGWISCWCSLGSSQYKDTYSSGLVVFEIFGLQGLIATYPWVIPKKDVVGVMPSVSFNPRKNLYGWIYITFLRPLTLIYICTFSWWRKRQLLLVLYPSLRRTG